jgi:hypothetical protein
MARVRYLILLSLALVVFGCSSAWLLPDTNTLEEPVAILPVIPAHIIMPANSEEEYAKMVKRANSVLNRLAKENKSKLLGPKKVRKLLDKSDLESLYVLLDEPGDHAKNTKSKKVSEIFKRLEVGKIIRVKVQIMHPHGYGRARSPGSPIAMSQPIYWQGWVDVSVELFSVSPPQLIATGYNHKEFWGETGWASGWVALVPVIFPYETYERPEGIALTQAAHEAIAEVLTKSTWDNRDE